MYFAEGGFGDFKGYILITMNVFSIGGSVSLGLVYQHTRSEILKKLVIWMSLVVMVASFIGVRVLEMVPENRWSFLLLIGVIGFCLMGNFNILATN